MSGGSGFLHGNGPPGLRRPSDDALTCAYAETDADGLRVFARGGSVDAMNEQPENENEAELTEDEILERVRKGVTVKVTLPKVPEGTSGPVKVKVLPPEPPEDDD